MRLLQFTFRPSTVLLFHTGTSFGHHAKMVLTKLHQLQDVMRAREFDDRVDLTHHLSYNNQRELDAFARCMAVQHPCTAVVKYQERGGNNTTFETFFNHSPGEGRYAKFSKDKIAEYGREFLDKLPTTVDAVAHVLKYSTLRILDEHHTPGALREYSYDREVSRFKSKYQDFKSKLSGTNDTTDIFSKYTAFLQDFYHLQQTPLFHPISKHLRADHEPLQRQLIDDFEDLFIVLQDVVKLSSTIPAHSIHHVKQMPNLRGLHCEVVAEQRQKELQQDANICVVDYIGISKLSCFLCELVVEPTPHRGKHGVFYWYDITAKVLSSKELSEKLVTKVQHLIETRQDIFGPAQIGSVGDFINASEEQIRELKFSATYIRQTAELSHDPQIEQDAHIPSSDHHLSFHDFKEAVGLAGSLSRGDDL